MYRDMLHLGERLVIAMETISQDVKNISAYVYDLSCCVSYLMNEKRRTECISVATHDKGENPECVTSASGQEASAEREYSEQYEQAEERPSLHTGDPEHGESSNGDIASTIIDPHENLESNPIFTERIKTEELSEDEVNDESCEMYDIHGSSGATNRDFTAHMTWMPQEQVRIQPMGSVEDASVVHTRVNLEERPYKCSVCEKSFKAGYDLRNHFRVHTGERPYKCNVCKKSYSRTGHLSLHMRSHTDERPYSCNVCGKGFRQKIHLTVHMRVHTGEYPFKCNVCGKAFRHSRSLSQHMRTHSGEHST